MEDKTIVNVTNKSTGMVIFSTSRGRRAFNNGQTHKIPLEELKELAQQDGGPELIYNYLYISDPNVMTEELEIKPEPEYYIKEAELPNWMETCTLDQFKDALDFAPEGTKDLIKKLAIEMPLNDYGKRQAIKEQLNFDVTKAIENVAPDAEDEAVAAATTKATTRRASTTTTENTGRRSTITVPKK